MRPVSKGDWPKNPDGTEIKYTEYAKARGELINRLGEYCSYCEMHLDASLAVEHVQPKKPDGATAVMTDRESDWHNFLLACQNCNSTKGNIDVVLNNYFWPHRDNTFRALTYSEGGLISPSNKLSIKLKEKAKATIALTGLDKHPLNNSKASDRRWNNRCEVWDIAQRNKNSLSRNFNNTDFRETIVDVATGHAYWSVWMTIFKDDPDMLQRFIEAFPGTCRECFDNSNQFAPVARPGGQV